MCIGRGEVCMRGRGLGGYFGHPSVNKLTLLLYPLNPRAVNKWNVTLVALTSVSFCRVDWVGGGGLLVDEVKCGGPNREILKSGINL